MRPAIAIAVAGLWALPAASQEILPVVYRCFVEDGGVQTTPPSPLALTQFTLHWRPATGDQPSTLKLLHEYFSNAPLTPEAAAATIAGAYAGEDSKGRARTATVTTETPDDSEIGVEFVEPFDLTGQSARFGVTARCIRQ